MLRDKHYGRAHDTSVLDTVEIKRPRPGLVEIRGTEDALASIARLAESDEFESVEEMEDHLRRLAESGHGMPKIKGRTPGEKAQDLIYRAASIASKKRRLDLARKALEVSPDCADAYTILAQAEQELERRLSLFEQGVAAGERALQSAQIDLAHPGEGEMWSLDARPYMRARLGLAQCLWEMGRKDEAIEHYKAMLDMNPQDNQGVRYLLINALIDLGRLEEAEKLIRRFEDDVAAEWVYARAYLSWTMKGDCAESRVDMRKAYLLNPYVPAFLTGERRLPCKMPDYVGVGDEDEALVYAAMMKDCWARTPGLITWMGEVITEFTGGLPSPLGIDTIEVRERIRRAWFRNRVESGEAAMGSGRELLPGNRRGRDYYLGVALAQHSEFGVLWAAAPRVGSRPFVVGGINLLAHLLMHAALEKVLNEREDALGQTLRNTRRALVGAGVNEHEAFHVILQTWMLQFEKCMDSKGLSVFDLDAFRHKLDYVANIASGAVKVDSRDGRPERNDQCPCRAGRKFKKCCGRDWEWPIQSVKTLTVEIRKAGKVPPPGGLGALTWVGDGRYLKPLLSRRLLAGPAGRGALRLEDLIEAQPLVRMDNASGLAREFRGRGYSFLAWFTLEEIVKYADGLGDLEALKTAVEEAIAFAREMKEQGDMTYATLIRNLVSRLKAAPPEMRAEIREEIRKLRRRRERSRLRRSSRTRLYRKKRF